MPAPRILLIDDDRKLSRMVTEYLQAQGFEVSAVHDGAEGLRRLTADSSWSLVILDVMLPGMDGFEVLRRIRAVSRVSVLMLTGRGGEEDRICGLNDGADDYLPKTASSRELLARIRALLRRVATQNSGSEGGMPIIVVGGLRLNCGTRAATLHGQLLPLTPVEFDLLVLLAQTVDQVRSREFLLERIRGVRSDPFDRAIDVHIVSLRRKLGDDPRAPRFIHTIRTAGYMLVTPERGDDTDGGGA